MDFLEESLKKIRKKISWSFFDFCLKCRNTLRSPEQGTIHGVKTSGLIMNSSKLRGRYTSPAPNTVSICMKRKKKICKNSWSDSSSEFFQWIIFLFIPRSKHPWSMNFLWTFSSNHSCSSLVLSRVYQAFVKYRMTPSGIQSLSIL